MAPFHSHIGLFVFDFKMDLCQHLSFETLVLSFLFAWWSLTNLAHRLYGVCVYIDESEINEKNRNRNKCYPP